MFAFLAVEGVHPIDQTLRIAKGRALLGQLADDDARQSLVDGSIASRVRNSWVLRCCRAGFVVDGSRIVRTNRSRRHRAANDEGDSAQETSQGELSSGYAVKDLDRVTRSSRERAIIQRSAPIRRRRRHSRPSAAPPSRQYAPSYPRSWHKSRAFWCRHGCRAAAAGDRLDRASVSSAIKTPAACGPANMAPARPSYRSCR
jgi:hypothetical protein